MQRVAFKMKLSKGKEAEYKKRHDEIWPELKSLLKVTGIEDYSIFSSRFPGSPPILNRANLVPPEPNAQLGIATWNLTNFFRMSSAFFSPVEMNSNFR